MNNEDQLSVPQSKKSAVTPSNQDSLASKKVQSASRDMQPKSVSYYETFEMFP